MRTVKFYGESDDLFEIDGAKRGEPDEISPGAVKVANDHGGLIVVADYARGTTPGASWVLGISLIDEDVPLPGWPMRWSTHKNGYSPLLEIDVPDDVRISLALSESDR